MEDELLKMQDLKYREFHKKILGDNNIALIGIRVPILKEYAKKISKENELEFWLNNIEENYYEEIMLKGLIIGDYKNLTYNELERYIRYYVPKISNWALCDTFCSNLKITRKYKEEMWNLINEYLKSRKEFEVRFALVMILNYYITDDYINQIFNIVNEVMLDEYYVKMANAWLISYCFIKYFEKTKEFYKKDCKIDVWTYNKGIQKSIESYRLTNEQKNELRKLKK